MKKSLWTKVLTVLVVIFIAIQFIPYGRNHDNPPVTRQVNWANGFTKETFYNACADCHSNETKWPWYSNIAPVSWLIQSDVNEGREHFNISVPDGLDEAYEAGEEVEKDKMPLAFYKPLHPDATLEGEQKAKFIDGLNATFKKETHIDYQEENLSEQN